MYTIKRAAELTGLSVATLRAWERRYGIVTPRRSESGYRLYDADDLRALAVMNSLVNDGWAAGPAAAETLSRLVQSDLTTDGPWQPGLPPSGPTHVSGGATSEPSGAVSLSSPGSRVESAAGLSTDAAFAAFVSDTEAFVDAARRLDAEALATVLDARFALARFETVVDGWLMPALQRVGEAWADGRIGVASEHLVAFVVQSRLTAAYEAAAMLGSGPVVIVGLAPGAQHELGLLAFAVAARRSGFATVYVGADLLVDEWVKTVTSRSAEAVVMAVPRAVDVPPTEQIVERLRDCYPHLLIGIGGREQGSIGSGCTHLGHGIGSAVDELSRRVRIPA